MEESEVAKAEEITTGNVVLITFFDVKIVKCEFLPQGQTIN